MPGAADVKLDRLAANIDGQNCGVGIQNEENDGILIVGGGEIDL